MQSLARRPPLNESLHRHKRVNVASSLGRFIGGTGVGWA